MLKNCWDLKECGREEGGKNSHLGICPAYTTNEFNNVNRGINSGRFCWYVSGTFCKGEIQGTFALKRLSCISCNVYLQIKKEENLNFVLTV
jgi:hypothetical protein